MKAIKALLIILGITIILVVVSINLFPKWLTIPGGILILLGLAINSVLEAGENIRSWIELLEKKNANPKEDELKRNLKLKRKIEKDFGDWLNYFPKNRKRNSKMILRAFDGNQYPDLNKPDKFGEYSWFAAEIKNLYHNGIEFICGVEELAVFNDNKWDFRKNAKGEILATITAYRVGQINFSDIVDYDLEGDEYFPFPHFFCKFTHKGLPFEEIYFTSIDDKHPHDFEFKNKKY